MTYLSATSSYRRPMTGLVSILALSLLCACATQETTQTGFLDHGKATAAPLQQDTKKSGRLFYATNAKELARYRAFMVDEITFKPGLRIPETFKPEDIAELKASYKASLEAAFAQSFEKAAAPGDDVLRVRAAITGFERANVTVNVLTSLVIGPTSAGGASSEAEVVDSMTGTRLAAVATHTNGSLMLGGPLGFFSTYGHARRALDRHAQDLVELVTPSAFKTTQTQNSL
jgi:hypothetical protein